MKNAHRLTVLFLVALIAAFAVCGCGPTNMTIEQSATLSPYGTPLEKIAEMTIVPKTVTQGEVGRVYNEAYAFTLFDKMQDIDKGQKPCHSDAWYTACVEKDKIVVTKLQTKEVAKTVDTGPADFIGDITVGDSFFTAVMAKGVLHVLYYRYTTDEAGKSEQKKVIRKEYPLTGLGLEGKAYTLAIRKQAVPGYAVWIAAVEKEDLKAPLYEILFVGTDEKTPYISQIVVEGQ